MKKIKSLQMKVGFLFPVFICATFAFGHRALHSASVCGSSTVLKKYINLKYFVSEESQRKNVVPPAHNIFSYMDDLKYNSICNNLLQKI